MKNLFTCLAALTLAVVVIGCAKKDNAAAVNESVTDVNVAPVPPREPEVAFTAPADAAPVPAAPEPVWAEPAPAVSETPVAAAPASTGGGSYTVKKGDTLFSIAKQSYGSGKDWQRIVAANPGLSPSTLKAGKTIVIP
jgi:nucleoid-associated protein YgaU